MDILNFTKLLEYENCFDVFSKPISMLLSISRVLVFLVPECILKFAIMISASGVGKKLKSTLPPDIIPTDTKNIPIATMNVTYL